MDAPNSRRVRIFITGVVIGTFLSMIMFSVWQDSDHEKRPTKKLAVVMAACNIKAGDTLTEPCATTREGVAEQFVPPGALLAKDRDWHIGKRLKIDIEKGNAFRTEDFE